MDHGSHEIISRAVMNPQSDADREPESDSLTIRGLSLNLKNWTRSLRFDHENILYRGEGNRSIVVALRHEGFVIRLLKKDKLEITGNDPTWERSTLCDLVRFHKETISGIVSRTFLDSARIIELTEEQMFLLNDLIQSSRPPHRLLKSIPIRDVSALLLPDYCSLVNHVHGKIQVEGPVIGVEIKPKQGFVNPVDRLPASAYCLKQFEKLKQQTISSISNYCPLDLFSGCLVRQKQALVNLMQSPQNNFRIFKDLAYVYGEERRGDSITQILEQCFPETNANDNMTQETFISLILQALNQSASCDTDAADDSLLSANALCCQIHCDRADNACQCLQHGLKRDSVLANILRGQMLDTASSQKTLEMASYLMCKNGNFLPELRSKKMMTFGSPNQYPGETLLDFYFRLVWQYFVSLTLKDCSIIVTMQRVKGVLATEKKQDFTIVTDETTGSSFVARVAVIDLDSRFTNSFTQLEKKIMQKDVSSFVLQDQNANNLLSQ